MRFQTQSFYSTAGCMVELQTTNRSVRIAVVRWQRVTRASKRHGGRWNHFIHHCFVTMRGRQRDKRLNQQLSLDELSGDLPAPPPPPLPVVSRQAACPGGDQELHHPVSGQRGLPDQHSSQQCAADAGHPGLAAATHGVLHQPHLTGRSTASNTHTHTHTYLP